MTSPQSVYAPRPRRPLRSLALLVLSIIALLVPRLTFAAPNNVPVANPNSAAASEDTSVTITVLNNDSDADGDVLTVTFASSGTRGGRTTVNANGTIRYTPALNFNGTDTFTYTISDGKDGTATTTVTVSVMAVNDAPLAFADSTTTNEDTAVAVTVTANDRDVDGDPLTVTSVTQGQNGSVTINPNGTVTYTPNANYNGADSFTYTINDGKGGKASAEVSVNVPSVNDMPVAINDNGTTNEEVPVVIGVKSNDNDPDNDPLTVTSVTQGQNGSVTINADGTVTYTPNANYSGTDTFTYTISDGKGGTATATVTVTINPLADPPVAINDSATTNENTAVVIGVKGNDSDPDNDPLTVTSVTQGQNGSVTINADGTVTYTPNVDYDGTDSFTYTISDGNGGTATATVNVIITPDNDAPNAVNDTATALEQQPVTIPVIGNDSDPDGTLNPASVSIVSGPSYGQVVVNPDGSITYTPNDNFVGTETFTYQVCDTAVPALCSIASVTITVTDVNDPPVAQDDTTATQQNTPVVIDPLINDNDVDGTLNPTSVQIVAQPAHGSVTVDQITGQITYTPDATYAGNDTFTYVICDNDGACADANVTVVTTVDPSSIELRRFTAIHNNGVIDIGWETGAEIDTYGFNVYRSTDGTWASAEKITPTIILGTGRSGGGASYEFRDNAVEAGKSYTYWLQEIELGGQQNLYGPTETVQVPMPPARSAALYRMLLPLATR